MLRANCGRTLTYIDRFAEGAGLRPSGGRSRAINVIVDTDRLASYALSIDDVRQALIKQNLEVPGGLVDQGSRELVLRTLGRIESPEQFNDLIVANRNGYPIRIRDVGRFATFLGRSPDTATPDDVRQFQIEPEGHPGGRDADDVPRFAQQLPFEGALRRAGAAIGIEDLSAHSRRLEYAGEPPHPERWRQKRVLAAVRIVRPDQQNSRESYV